MGKIDFSKLSVVIPVFNEEENIVGVIERLRKTVGDDAEVIVVDDGSTDRTPALLEKENVQTVRHPYNKGNGASIKTGTRTATRDFILFMDGDAQHRPEDIPKLIEHLDTYDMVVGARTPETVQSTGRRLYNKSLNYFASYITGHPIPDLTSGFRAIKRKVARGFLHLLPNSFSYPTTITLSMMRAGFSVGFVPLTFDTRRGHSKIRPVRDGLRFMTILARIASIFSPMRVFLPISLFFFGGGIVWYIYTFITSHRFTNLTLFMLSTGVVVFMLGLVAEQISLLRFDRVEDDFE